MKLDSKSKDILGFRPKIEFVEPDQQDSPIEPVQEDPRPQQVENKRVKIKNLAESVNNLARAVQYKIDNKAKDQIVVLDSNVDNVIVRSLRRSYPGADAYDRITYDQYKRCRDRLRDYAQRTSLRSKINDADVDEARNQLAQGKFTVGGIGTEEANNGGLRPELDDRNTLIEPLDMDATQQELLKMLFEMIWNNFIVPILKNAPIVGSLFQERDETLAPWAEEMIADVKENMSNLAGLSESISGDIEAGRIPSAGAGRDKKKSSPNLAFPKIDNPMQLQDCQAIVKAYEKGCHASMTEASVFAPFTGQLDFIRNMSSTISDQMDQYISGRQESEDDDQSFGEFLDGIFSKLSVDIGVSIDEEIDIGLDSECIPCGLRINFKEDLNLKAGLDDLGAYLLEMMTAWLVRALSQIRNLIDMFKNLDRYADICALINFFKDFVCIPDLAKILAVLAALMMDLSFELNFVVDLAISLIVPLFMPFLTNLLDGLMKYVLLVLKPIECIIDSIQDLLGKLDYNVLFQNIPDQITLFGGAEAGAGVSVKIPVLGNLIPEPIDTGISGEALIPPVTIDLTPFQRAQRAKEQAAIDRAYENLQKLKKSAGGVDASDPEAYKKYKEQEQKAREEYRDALKERDLSEIGEVNQELEKFQTQIKSTVLQLMGLLREAVLKFDAWVRGIFDEFKKLLNQFMGGSGLYFNFGVKKLAIIQMIAFIKAVIDFLKGDIDCEPDEEVEAYASILSQELDFKVFTDENGAVYIEENIDEIDDIADALNVQDPNSLLNYTGDSVLDATLDDTLRKLSIPNSLKIKCSLNASVAEQAKVNQWISELNTSE